MNTANLKASLAAVGDAPGLRVCDASELYPRAEAGQALLRYEGVGCRAVVSPHGAQVLAFQPKGGPELLWTSPLASFRPGRPIRGGIPVCLPWFGPHPDQPDQPKHGYARLREWQLTAAGPLSTGRLGLRFELECDTGPEFPFSFRATLGIGLGETLHLQLDIYNKSDLDLPLSWAFHSYLAVEGLASARVSGLSGRRFLDNAGLGKAQVDIAQANRARPVRESPANARGSAGRDRPPANRDLPTGTQRGEVCFGEEVDRVYTGVGGSQWLYQDACQDSRQHPPQQPGQQPGRQLCGNRSVEIAGSGCDTVIVWNPGERLGSGMTDIGDHFDRFVCVERGAAFGDRWCIPPAASGSASMTLRQGSGASRPGPDASAAVHPSQKER